MAINDETVTPEELPPISEKAEWRDHLPALLTDVVIAGGSEGKGAANFQARVLDARTRYLKQLLETIQVEGLGGVFLQGMLDTEAELDAIPTEGLKIGTAWFLNFELRVWNGAEWASSGSLRGERGINLLGAWPDSVPLPQVQPYFVGDGFLWKSDIWVLVPVFSTESPVPPDTPPVWEPLGVRGPDGKSTFELWKELPGNANKTLAQFIAEQKGDKGDDAYESWLKIPDNKDKSRAQWVEETRGVQGETGPARAPFLAVGTKETTSQLPYPGKEEEAWYIGLDMYVWSAQLDDYFMVAGVSGKSAFDIWRASDPDFKDATEAQFLQAIKGAKGEDSKVPGPPGIDGRNLRIIGTVSSWRDLQYIKDPVDQDAYATLDDGRLWMFLPADGGWKDLGPWRGVDGRSAYQVWLADGHEGESTSAFWAFLRGKDGVSLFIRGAVETFADLPDDPEEQWLYGVKDVNSLYVFVEGAWLDLGRFAGKDGRDGIDGKSLDIIKILTEEDPTPPASVEANKGKAYVDLNKDVWVNVSGFRWQSAGRFVGDTGEIGPPGNNFRPKGMVENIHGLPKPSDKPQEGDAYVLADNKMMYALVDGQWSGPIDLIGPQGDQGIQGIPGALMPILGAYKTMALLKAAHPTGTLGDAYMIVDPTATPEPIRDLAIWSVEGNDWLNTGPAGVKGDKGEKGDTGADSKVPGERGSMWLTLDTNDAPSNTFNGRAGDWAVNKLMRVYYKTVNQGWVYWGILMAGDVNSPLESEGKVVRLGNAWVPIPVDEVMGAEEGLFYGRTIVGKDEGNNPILDWREIKSITDLTVKNGKQYVRMFKTDGNVPVWEELVVSFDRYSLPIKSYAASTTIDAKVDQVIALNNSTTTAKVLTLADGPKGASARAVTLVITIAGSAGLVTFAPTGATVLDWNDGSPPVMSGKLTNIVLWWTGVQWVGMRGAKVP